MVTMRDIARESGYSLSTVSRVVNQEKYVSDEVRAKVQAVIDAHDYATNRIAQDLSHGENRVVGVVLPDNRHPYFEEILRGITDRAFESDHRFVLLPSRYDKDKEAEFLEGLRHKEYSSLIFTSHRLPLTDFLKYQKYGPIVCLEHTNLPISSVYSERIAAAKDAFRWLKAQGPTSIALLFSRATSVSATNRQTQLAFEKVFGYSLPDQDIYTGMYTFDDGYHIAPQLVKRQYQTVFANSDDIASGIYQYYRVHQLTQPIMIGQEQQTSGQLLSLSTINHNLFKIGQRAFELAESTEVRQVPVPAAFVLRNSSEM